MVSFDVSFRPPLGQPSRRRNGALLLALFLPAAVLSLTSLSTGAAFAAAGRDRLTPIAGRPAVAAANIRIVTGYAYSHANQAKSTLRSSPTTIDELPIDEADFNAARLEIIGTLPLTNRIGLRGSARGNYSQREEDINSFAVGNSNGDLTSYGVTTDLFLRDPSVGSLSAGASFDQLDGQNGFGADRIGASAEAAIFFPNFGSGHVDWSLRFDYARQDVSGQSDPTLYYTATAGAGWYLSNNSQLVLGGSWSRMENDFLSEEDLEGFLQFRWLPEIRIPVELSLVASAGSSKYKESPFPEEDRLIYGGAAELTFRFRSGPTLLKMIRGYD
jgi:hypothetical protein